MWIPRTNLMGILNLTLLMCGTVILVTSVSLSIMYVMTDT